MVKKENLVLTAENKKPILYDLYYKKSSSPIPLVIFCHGYKGFKDWGAWHLVAEAFANAGFCFLKFNFSHNGGTVEQPIDFPDLNAFAENNFSHELDDIDRVITAIKNGNENLTQKISDISIIGHSRGGGIALIKAEDDNRIHKVVTWASVSDFKPRFQENTENFEKWKETGVTYVENSRTKQQLPHHFQFYEDYKANENLFSIKRAVQHLSVPLLIIHGEEDETVPIKEAQAIHSWNGDSNLQIIKNGDHVFGSQHPWNQSEMPEDLKKVVALTIDFLK